MDNGKMVSAPRLDWVAPEGKLWTCPYCGKVASYRQGFRPGMPCSPGWNAVKGHSCFLFAQLEDRLSSPFDSDIFQ